MSTPFRIEPVIVREAETFRVMDLGAWRWMITKSSPPYKIAGKYVFFSRDQKQLAGIAEREILNHGFHRAKWSHTLNGEDYVLCLYFGDAARGPELARRARSDGWECEPSSTYRWTLPAGTASTTLRFRWWKSEEATEAELLRALAAT